jgi:hypothetical protein
LGASADGSALDLIVAGSMSTSDSGHCTVGYEIGTLNVATVAFKALALMPGNFA